MADKIPTILETCLQNDGRKTILSSYLAPGSTTFPHYHTKFNETFVLRSGSLTVYQSEPGSRDPGNLQATQLAVGESATIPIRILHKFLAGEDGCTCEVILEPGTLDFERAVLIMRGTQKDGVYQSWGHGPDEENALLLAVMGDLTDSHAVGNDAEMMGEQLERKVTEIRRLKEKLLAMYATDELVKQAAGQDSRASMH